MGPGFITLVVSTHREATLKRIVTLPEDGRTVLQAPWILGEASSIQY